MSGENEDASAVLAANLLGQLQAEASLSEADIGNFLSNPLPSDPNRPLSIPHTPSTNNDLLPAPDQHLEGNQDQTSNPQMKNPTIGPSPSCTPTLSSAFKAVTPHRLNSLHEELACSICLDLCVRPCTTPCGHNFCRQCLRLSLRHDARCAKCRQVLPPRCEICVNTLPPPPLSSHPPLTPPNQFLFMKDKSLTQSSSLPLSLSPSISPSLKV